MAIIRESQLVTWTVERDTEGRWALMARVGGDVQRLSDTYATREELVFALGVRIREVLQVPAPVTTE